MTLPRVVYLSAPPLGEQMLKWLQEQPCKVVNAVLDDRKIEFAECICGRRNDSDKFRQCVLDILCPVCDGGAVQPRDYDLGLNFLGSNRIPASEFKAKKVWVNFHPAPLPEFGGRNVAYHAIMKGAEKFGATVHYMDENFDTGEIIEVWRFPIKDTDTAGDLMEHSKECLVKMFKSWVPELLKGKVASFPQHGKTKYHKKTDIDGFIPFTAEQKRLLRALTCHPKHHAKVAIGDDWYSIVKDEK